ncbi:MAG: aldehyde dehydrogenase family protein [Solirubrobacteraceae bacterium]
MSRTAPSLPDALGDGARDFLSQLLIGGERVAAADGRTFETLDPATGRLIATVAHGGARDVGRAVRAARAAFEEGPWPMMAPEQRSAIIRALAYLVEANKDELSQLEALDNSKPVKPRSARTPRRLGWRRAGQGR